MTLTLILLVSTPKTKSLSRIEREYEASDRRRFFVPCPHCGEHQALEFANLRWPEGRPREAEYACAHCGSLIGERHKTWMLEHGEWRATAPGEGRTAGFHLSSLYSPVGWFSWADAAEMYEQAQRMPDLMKGFVNTVLGLPFEEEAEAPEWQRLYERRESYGEAGADVEQLDRHRPCLRCSWPAPVTSTVGTDSGGSPFSSPRWRPRVACVKPGANETTKWEPWSALPV